NLTHFAALCISEVSTKFYLEIEGSMEILLCLDCRERRKRTVLLEEEINRLYRIRKMMMQMLRDRDYLILEENMARTWREDLVINKSYSDHIYVFFPEEAKVGVKTVKTYANRMNSENAFRTILLEASMGIPLCLDCRNIVASLCELQLVRKLLMQEAKILINIKEYVLVPKHQRKKKKDGSIGGGNQQTYKIKKTVMKMLRDRNYLVGDFKIKMSREDFRRKYGENMKREDLVINKSKKDNSSDQIYVFFPEEAKVGVKTLKTYTNQMNSNNFFQGYLVLSIEFNIFCLSKPLWGFYYALIVVLLLEIWLLLFVNYNLFEGTLGGHTV
ncbi:hypothetical protein S245_036417, partial [Arachis hypogaea]